MSKLKGQINLEFLAAAGLYLLALGIIIIGSGDTLPSYQQGIDKVGLNLESRTLTNEIISNPGKHSYDGGGTDWERSEETVENVDSFGLGDKYMDVDRSKVESLSTIGDEDLNYSQFREITEVDNQYRFRFTWLPIAHTDRSFTRGSPPANPGIVEPENNEEEPYTLTDNEVHYGSVTLNNRVYTFLVTARNGVYNATYVSDFSWDFENSQPIGQGESFEQFNTEFTVESFQNRENEEGAIIVLKQPVNEFGATRDSQTSIEKITRYPIMDEQPLRMEVWFW